ncbi:hypothetical protein ASF65_03615 [Aureimonas sp. Leaf324]|nr:hypothetical protein ASF65_03615 [Aureimonas sp. Leaf324]
MDSSPLSILGTIDALDWLYAPGCEVWMTDLVLEEVTRDPGEDRDRRNEIRSTIADWIEANRWRIKRIVTREGRKYAREMELWRLAGNPPDLKPNWGDRGERSVLDVLKSTSDALGVGESFLVVVDDREARDAVRVVRADVDMMGTRTFIRMVHVDYGVEEAADAWTAVRLAKGLETDDGVTPDPVYIRRRSIFEP